MAQKTEEGQGVLGKGFVLCSCAKKKKEKKANRSPRAITELVLEAELTLSSRATDMERGNNNITDNATNAIVFKGDLM